MSNEYVRALFYLFLGCIGPIIHWAKKRFKDKTTKCTLLEYIKGDVGATLSTFVAILLAEIPLSIAQAGPAIAMTELVGAITAGYMLDSISNTAPDKLAVESENVMVAIAEGIDPSAPGAKL